jgi:hypothetical protein
MGERNYCIIVMDNTSKVEEDLEFIITEPLRIVNNKKDTVIVATFKTPLSPIKIKKALNVGNKRSFFIFELDAESCSAHIDEEHLQEFLFGSLDVDTEVLVEEENREFIEEHSGSELPYRYDEAELSNLTEEERDKLIDKLLNNVKTLTNNQKKSLSFLASL